MRISEKQLSSSEVATSARRKKINIKHKRPSRQKSNLCATGPNYDMNKSIAIHSCLLYTPIAMAVYENGFSRSKYKRLSSKIRIVDRDSACVSPCHVGSTGHPKSLGMLYN